MENFKTRFYKINPNNYTDVIVGIRDDTDSNYIDWGEVRIKFSDIEHISTGFVCKDGLLVVTGGVFTDIFPFEDERYVIGLGDGIELLCEKFKVKYGPYVKFRNISKTWTILSESNFVMHIDKETEKKQEMASLIICEDIKQMRKNNIL